MCDSRGQCAIHAGVAPVGFTGAVPQLTTRGQADDHETKGATYDIIIINFI